MVAANFDFTAEMPPDGRRIRVRVRARARVRARVKARARVRVSGLAAFWGGAFGPVLSKSGRLDTDDVIHKFFIRKSTITYPCMSKGVTKNSTVEMCY